MRRLILFSIIALLALSTAAILNVLAQSEAAWGPPVNLSQSGAASLPIVAVAPDGTLHAVWWDSLFGEEYARATPGVTQTTWSKPAIIPALWGERQVVTSTQTGRISTALTAPRDTRLIVDTKGNTYALWLDAFNQLQATQNRGTVWSEIVTALSDAAIAFDVTADLSGTLQLAYVRPKDTPGTPAGIYYRSTTSGDWSAPTLVYASPYFRVSRFEDLHLSVTGDGSGLRLVVWDDTRLGQSFYSFSTDNGRTWNNPQPVTGNDTDAATQAYATASPDGGFIMFWQDPSRTGCSLSQRRSVDGGKNWQSPERILTRSAQCPGRWKFALGSDKRLWLMGTSLPGSASKTVTNLLAAWDGQAWSDVIEINSRFRESSTNKTINLSCINMALDGQRLGIIGCDGNGDVWATQNNIGLDQFLPALKPAWLSPRVLSDKTSRGSIQSLPALVAVEPGKFLAMWSQSSADTERGMALYISSSDGATWSRAAQVLKSPADSTSTGNALTSKAEQPSLAADNQSRLHAVWSGGSSGEVLYSWSYVQDATSPSGWSVPLALPSAARVGSWPDIAADPRGEALHVLYAIPYNEGRGIYYVHSRDGGSTWAKPTVVLDAASAKWTGADKPRLALDFRANVLHAVWLRANLPSGTGSQAVYYANSKDEGQTWSAPVHVAEGLVDWPRIAVVGTNQVLLVWNQARSGNPNAPGIEAWSQFSSTGGDRWSAAARVGSLGEVSGPTGLASDGSQAFLVGVGPGSGGEDALVHARWNGPSWEAHEKMGLGQNYAPGSAAAAAIAANAGKLGAALLMWAKQSDGSSQLEIWATQRDVSALPSAAPIPIFTPLPTSTGIPTATPQPTATVKPQLPAQSATQVSKNSPLPSQSPLIASGVLTVIIVISLLVLQAVLHSRRR